MFKMIFILTECPPADDGMERFACPAPDQLGRYRCVDDHVLCDGYVDCPEGEDEDRKACMFYKTVSFSQKTKNRITKLRPESQNTDLYQLYNKSLYYL